MSHSKHSYKESQYIQSADSVMHTFMQLYIFTFTNVHLPSPPESKGNATHQKASAGPRITHISPEQAQIAVDGCDILGESWAVSLHTNDRELPLNLLSLWLTECECTVTDSVLRGANAQRWHQTPRNRETVCKSVLSPRTTGERYCRPGMQPAILNTHHN